MPAYGLQPQEANPAAECVCEDATCIYFIFLGVSGTRQNTLRLSFKT